jgi:glutamate 5-kinase
MKKLFVLKIGSSSLTTENGRLDTKYLDLIAETVFKNVIEAGNEIIIVTSGAIATGIGLLNIEKTPKLISEKQALAAVGQVELMNQYSNAFAKYGKHVAQILLTKSQIEDRKRYLNIKNTIFTLLKKGIIPIINENDTVSVSEIKFGDNDTLSALVASKVLADMLVILTDVDGVYTSNPRQNPDAKLVKTINIKDYKNLGIDFSAKTGSKRGTGGMLTKFKAAQIACLSDVKVFITNGKDKQNVKNLFKNFDLGTTFLPDTKFFNQKEHWMAFSAKTKGSIIIDDGAENALLNNGKSLLAIGIISVEGNFSTGDIVDVKNTKNTIIAKGTVEYSSTEVTKIKDLKTEEIKKIYNKEIIHRDNMVVLF